MKINEQFKRTEHFHGKRTQSKNRPDGVIEDTDLTVLIVDDDYAIRDSLCGYLESVGWHTIAAETAELALEIVEGGKGDIVVTDVRMPGMDGIDLTTKLIEIDPCTYIK